MDVGMAEVIEYINGIPDVVVFAIVNDDTKSVYIMHTLKFRSKFGEIADLVKEFGGRVEYFSICPHPVYKLVMAEKVRLQYINNGYKIVNQISAFMRFTPSIRVDSESKHVLVYITSSRGLREIVGVFGTMAEAQSFYDEFYGASWDGSPVYSTNERTRVYWVNVVYKRKYQSRGKQSLIESSNATQIYNTK